MLSASDRIEHSIYSFVAESDPYEGCSTNWGTLAAQVGQPNTTVLLHLLTDLLVHGYLEAKKWLNQHDCVYPSLRVPPTTSGSFTITSSPRFTLGAFGPVASTPVYSQRGRVADTRTRNLGSPSRLCRFFEFRLWRGQHVLIAGYPHIQRRQKEDVHQHGDH